MRPSDRATARRQLDKRLSPLRKADALVRPPRGWIKAIRESLGMTTGQLGRRMGVAQSRAVAIEQAEIKSAITLETLERAARALDCQLVYALIPIRPLDQLIEERAGAVARRRLASTRHSMALEAQGVGKEDEREQLSRLIRQLAERSGSELWEEHK